ncbi:MAG: hypothetical protein H6664_06895 [Ardenticatenaceae bacterium]|nr:hypothetical protein [Ardenticatenaceae bacterium]
MKRPSPLLFLAVALTTFTGMMLEIALTRALSILFFYNYVFVILSVAVLGMGLGAAVVHQQRKLWADGRLGWLALAAGGSVAGLGLLLAALVGVDGRLPLAVLILIPYLFIGMILAAAFTIHAEKTTSLYAADLSGAALGAAVTIPLLSWLDNLDALFLAAGLLALAAICFFALETGFLAKTRFLWPTVLIIIAIIGIRSNGFEIDISRLAVPKPEAQMLQNTPQAEIVYSATDAFARVDLVQIADAPEQQFLFVDGAAGSVMPRFPTTLDAERPFTGDIGFFPFHEPSDDVFIIGPGGGKDVLFALLGNAERITAVEISGQIVDAVREFSAYNGGLFDDPRVQVAVDEGRSYLRRTNAQFDLIYLSELVTLTAERNSYMLAENYAFTVEAFADYLDHLTPNGRIALKMYDELTLTRAFVTAVSALQQGGMSQETAVRHIVVLLDPDLVSAQDPFRSPVMLIYREPVTPEQGAALLTDIQQAGFIPLFVPHAQERPPLSLLATGETTLDDLVADFSRGDISATFDDAPFFYEFRRGLPDLLRQLLVGLAVLLLLGLGYLFWRRRVVKRGPFWQLTAYFALLGMGFMLVELAVIQRLTLFLGHPMRVLSVALFAILLGSGLGSWAAGRMAKKSPSRVILISALAVAVLALLFAFFVPALLDRLAGLSLAGRVGTVVLLILPIAFALGMPFPLGLQQARQKAGQSMIPLAWGVNGVASVVGSVTAVSLAMLWGFGAALLLAGMLYGLVALLGWQNGR